jgi:hypothetical protein
MSKELEKKELVVFGDTTGRVMIGRKISYVDGLLEVANPAIVHPQQMRDPNNPNNVQLSLSIIPNILLELLDQKVSEDPFTMTISNPVLYNNVKFSGGVTQTYKSIFEGAQVPQPQQPSVDADDGEEISIFEE